MNNLTDILAAVEKQLYGACQFHRKEKLLVAVSGGIDSVVLCELLAQLKVDFAVAHCNFQLRAADSDGDAVFVEALAKKYEVSFFLKTFETQAEAEKPQQSIQMVARKLRYEWFEEIRKENGFHAIATAHHQNDLMETMLYNLSKGTGIAGLHGIQARVGKIVRPMLTITKVEIVAFASKNDLQYREDNSNKSTKYARNKIRLEVIPKLKELNPALEKTFYENSQRFMETEQLYQFAIEQQKKKLVEQRKNDFFIPILKLQNRTVAPKTVLWETLKEFNFSSKQIEDIWSALNGESGKVFYSATHRLLKDRRFLILSELNAEKPSLFVVEETAEKVLLPDFKINIERKKRLNYSIENNPKIAAIDLDKLVFPLRLRRWKSGDYFYPIGLTKKNGKAGKQKLKKYFGIQKKSIHEKENMWILEDAQNRIVWLVGERLDDRFKVTDTTAKVYHLRIKQGK